MTRGIKRWGKALALACLAAMCPLAMAACSPDTGASAGQQDMAQQGKFPAFTARDLDGNTVASSDLFARKKITVVNIWGTFCPPCIGEMPELGAWAKEMPKDAQIVGIVCDVEGTNDAKTIGDAKAILQDAGASFPNLVPDGSLMQYLETVEAVPTTLFVDSQGNLVGQPVIGADVDAYRDAVKAYLRE